MPVLPPQSPARVGDAPDAAPARLMSRKSQSVKASTEMLLAVRVRGVPMVSERKKMRRTADAPAQVSVPLMVWLAAKVTGRILADDGAVIDKLLNVFVPVIVLAELPVPVKDTL